MSTGGVQSCSMSAGSTPENVCSSNCRRRSETSSSSRGSRRCCADAKRRSGRNNDIAVPPFLVLPCLHGLQIDQDVVATVETTRADDERLPEDSLAGLIAGDDGHPRVVSF